MTKLLTRHCRRTITSVASLPRLLAAECQVVSRKLADIERWRKDDKHRREIK